MASMYGYVRSFWKAAGGQRSTGTRRFGMPLPAAKPFTEMGVSGTVITGGYVAAGEQSSKWIGRQKYITTSEIVTNMSIVAAGVHHFVNLVAHPKWRVVPSDEQNGEAKKLADTVEEMIEDMATPWPRIVRRAAMYRFHGFGIQEWTAKKRDDGQVGMLDLEPRSQHTIERWELDDFGTVLGMWQRSPQTGQLLGLPRKKLVYLIEDTLTDSPEGLGIFRHLGEPYERLKQYLALEARAYERDLRGIPIARVPITLINDAVRSGRMTQEDATKAVKSLEDFVQMEVKQSNTGLVLDSMPYEYQASDGMKLASMMQWGLDLLTGSAAGLSEIAQAIDRLQREMARVIGVEHLMMGDQGGNRALAVDKSRNLYLIANSVLSTIATTLDRDFLDPLWTLNGWDEKLKPHFSVEDVAFKDVGEITAALRDMATAGATLSPDDDVIDDVRDLLGISRQPERSESEMAQLLAQSQGAMAGLDQNGKPAGGTQFPPPKGGEQKPDGTRSAVNPVDNSGSDEEKDVTKALEEYWDDIGPVRIFAKHITLLYKEEGVWREEDHPRNPEGSPGSTGGQFRNKDEPTGMSAGGNALLNDTYENQPPKKAVDLLARYDDPNITADQIIDMEGPEAHAKIAEAEKLNSVAMADTQHQYMDTTLGSYTPERRAIQDAILRDKTFVREKIEAARVAPGEQPVVYFLGGRGGSGKSWLTGKNGPLSDGKYIYINSDDYKEALPEYRGWNAAQLHEESSDMVAQAAKLATEGRLSTVFDVTMKSRGTVEQLAKTFKAAGYRVEGYYMFAPPQVAAQRALRRFLYPSGGKPGRYVPIKYVLSSRSNEDTFDYMTRYFSRWKVYDNATQTFGPRLVLQGGS